MKELYGAFHFIKIRLNPTEIGGGGIIGEV